MIALPPTDKDNNCLSCDNSRTSKKNPCKCPMGLYDKKGNEINPKQDEMWICGTSKNEAKHLENIKKKTKKDKEDE